MIELIFICILSSLTLLFLSLYLLQKKANKTLITKTLETLLMQQLSRSTSKTEKEQFNEDFLKFISDSREYAFKYIETTQEKINSFINDVGPVIDYLETYAPPVLAETQRISLVDGYKIIKTILPEDYGKIDT